MDRRAIILQEYGVYFPDTSYVYEFMNISERAFAQQEARHKAAKDGKQYIK